jgi:preprotein translocase subunit SecG
MLFTENNCCLLQKGYRTDKCKGFSESSASRQGTETKQNIAQNVTFFHTLFFHIVFPLFITARSEQTSSQAFQETQAHMK